MPRAHDLPSPLTRSELSRFLAALFHDAVTTSEIAIEAFAVTAASLYGWCDPVDIEAALEMISMPVPRCLHGRPWDACGDCGISKRQTVAPN